MKRTLANVQLTSCKQRLPSLQLSYRRCTPAFLTSEAAKAIITVLKSSGN